MVSTLTSIISGIIGFIGGKGLSSFLKHLRRNNETEEDTDKNKLNQGWQ
jgi:hypothetical protein